MTTEEGQKLGMPLSSIPKATMNTTAAKLMIVSWLVTLIVTYANNKGWIIPEFVKTQMPGVFEGLIDLAFTGISGWLTAHVAQHSTQRNQTRVDLAKDIIAKNQGINPSTNVNATLEQK